MKEWNVAEAKAKFSSMLHEATAEPQLICRRDQPVAVLVSVDTYRKNSGKQKQSVSRKLRELRQIQATELAEIDVPPRLDRTCNDFEP